MSDCQKGFAGFFAVVKNHRKPGSNTGAVCICDVTSESEEISSLVKNRGLSVCDEAPVGRRVAVQIQMHRLAVEVELYGSRLRELIGVCRCLG